MRLILLRNTVAPAAAAAAADRIGARDPRPRGREDPWRMIPGRCIITSAQESLEGWGLKHTKPRSCVKGVPEKKQKTLAV